MVKRFAFIAALSIAMPPALAQTMAVAIPAGGDSGTYLQDGRGIVVRNPFGLCWRSGTWTPGDAIIGCDGQLTPPIANPTAPEPALQAPPPAAPAPAVALPCDFTVTLANDEIFGFNMAVLSQSARRRLDEHVVGKLAACSRIDRLTVFGHADRLGTPQYNQKLSERRAGAVAGYLKNKGNFAEMETRGLGETQPTATCANSLPRRALVACLAPDRRIVIEVRGIAK